MVSRPAPRVHGQPRMTREFSAACSCSADSSAWRLSRSRFGRDEVKLRSARDGGVQSRQSSDDKRTGGGRARMALAMHVAAKEAAANPFRGGGRRGHGASFSLGDGESRIVRGNARARRGPCRARASATLAPPASQSRARSASYASPTTHGDVRLPLRPHGFNDIQGAPKAPCGSSLPISPGRSRRRTRDLAVPWRQADQRTENLKG